MPKRSQSSAAATTDLYIFKFNPMKLLSTPILLLGALLSLTSSHMLAQATWTDATGSSLFSDSLNWSSGTMPANGDALTLASSDPLAIDTGSAFSTGGITINAGISGDITALSGETLTIGTEGIVNLGNGLDLEIPTLADASQTWVLGNGQLIIANSFEVLSGVVTIDLTSSGTVTFAMNDSNPNWSGSLAFLGTIGATSIAVSGTGLTADNIADITINGNAVELVNGYLVAVAAAEISAVPEPSAYGIIAGLTCAGLLALRRFRRAQKRVLAT